MKSMKKYPIKMQILSIVFITSIFILITVGITYHKFSDIIYEKNNEYTIEMISKIKQNISLNVDITNRILTNIAYNNTVQKYLIEEDKVKKFEIFQDINKFISNMNTMKDGILEVTIVGNNGELLNVTAEKETREKIIAFAKQLPNNRYKARYSGFEICDYNGTKTNCILAGTNIYSLKSGKQYENVVGKLIMLLDLKAISPQIENMPQKIAGNFYVLDNDNNIFFSNEANKIGSKFNTNSLNKTNKSIITHFEYIPEIQCEIISIYEKKELFSGISEVRSIYILISVLFIGLISIMYVMITYNIIQPLQKFMKFNNKLTSGNLKNFKKRISLEGYSEISLMAKGYNTLLDEIDQLTYRLVDTTAKLYQLEISKKQAELEFLKSQINPHFLYNTLECIRGIAAINGVKEIINMTTDLSKIFRYSVKGDEEVILKQEINIIKAYIEIQKVRFEDRFEVNYDFTEEILQCKVIKMIFQPIVENAIIHGIEKKIGKSKLCIGGKVNQNNELLMWVYDNGVGMDEKIYNNMIRLLNTHQSSDENVLKNKYHIGIINVNNRIKLTYGNEYGIKIHSQKGKGTKVIITLPKRRGTNV